MASKSLTIGILGFAKPAPYVKESVKRFEEAAQAQGHTMVSLSDTRFGFSQGKIFYDDQPFTKPDVILCRPGFTQEPTLHTYVMRLLQATQVPLVNGHPDALLVKNKIEQHIRLAQNGLPQPRWGVTRSPEVALNLACEIGFPVIVKVPFGALGKGVFFAQDEKTFKPIVDYLNIRDGNPVLVEEFIHTSPCHDVRAFVIGGEVVCAMERRAEPEEVRANIGAGGTGMTTVLSKEETELALKATACFHLDVAGVDFLRSDRGPLLLEVNANPGFLELERATGMNVAEKMMTYCTGRVA